MRAYMQRKWHPKRIPVLLRGALVALIALLGVGLQSAHADIGGSAVLELSGRQIGLMANLDLSGLAITMR